ncbi:hypothetical protein [Spirosoma sp. KUDC1026]|uniref:hypothetical protein n=1 Tax=Spirosoma sp. KUDC1026 TaxID=2745947 RepID=UPI00159BEDD1|nr:hypothetical protein [Spirosoma sp. KUDC1026]QKZ11736.1 hypothetical protein HU175_03470 [Spirosoma sp. KUDC1026]
MKKDNLERFVRDNREAFDAHEPPDALWARLEEKLGPVPASPESPFREIHRNPTATEQQTTRKNWFRANWQVAASIAVLLLAGTFFYVNQRYGVSQQPELAVNSPAYAKEVVYYTQLIEEKRTEIKQLAETNPALYEEFSTDLTRLERNYQTLKAELPQNPNQETLIQAMIQNLQLQINLLNEQLRVIQCIKQQTAHAIPV